MNKKIIIISMAAILIVFHLSSPFIQYVTAETLNQESMGLTQNEISETIEINSLKEEEENQNVSDVSNRTLSSKNQNKVDKDLEEDELKNPSTYPIEDLQQILDLNSLWITQFLIGEALDEEDEYTQFPKDYQNYLNNNKIDWNSAEIGVSIGDEIKGTISLPRQYLYSNGNEFNSSDTVILGAEYGTSSNRNILDLSFDGYDDTEFSITVQEKIAYKIKEPQVTTSSIVQGDFTDLQEFEITVKRLEEATKQEQYSVNFNLNINWRTNPYFFVKSDSKSYWYDDYNHQASQTNHFVSEGKMAGTVSSNKLSSTPTSEAIMEDELVVETKSLDVPLSTNVEAREFIKEVKIEEKIISPDEYTVEFIQKPSSNKIGTYNTSIKVTLVEDTNKSKIVDTKVTIVWGSTLVAKTDKNNSLTLSLSLINDDDKPKIVANDGSGLASVGGSGSGHSRPKTRIFRDSLNSPITPLTQNSVGWTGGRHRDYWNSQYQELELEYGDVISMQVNKYSNASGNHNGNNTWISRNNALTRETQGYGIAYYELTKEGYRLMKGNQMKVINGNKLSLNTTVEEVNERIDEFITIPSQITNPEDFRMEFNEIDTKTSGNKTAVIKVYEALESGGEFMSTYNVNYTVNPVVTESYYDTEGNSIKESKKAEFNYGSAYQLAPENYLTKNDELYVYVGWLDGNQKPGHDTPNEGIPSATKVENDYYYIYEKADNYINLTMPIEMVFGTNDTSKDIQSKNYEIKNNSDVLTMQVTLDSLSKVKSEVTLLGENDTLPSIEEKSAKLNLLINENIVIKGLNENVKNRTLLNLEPNEMFNVGFSGTYFGNKSEKNIVEYRMKLKFKAISVKD